jgi:hypothetical protein
MECVEATYVVLGVLVEILGWDDLLADLFLDLLAELLSRDILAVLCGDDNGIDTEGHNSTAIVLVLDSDLSLGVRSQPRQTARVTSLLHSRVELVREQHGQGKVLRCLIGSISEHDTLITSAQLLERLLVVQTLCDIRRLLLDGHEHVAGLVVEALAGVVVADVLDGAADDLLVVEVCLGGDLAEDHDHACLGGRLAGDLGERVLLEAGIEDGV